MDEPGFHARRRADRADRENRKAGKLGGLQTTFPLGDDHTELHKVETSPDPVPTSPGAAAPLPPPKGRRVMSPHMSVMMGPILRYDTVIDFTYHAFALLVTSDVGSSYSPPPALLLEWDATGGAASLETAFADRLSLSDRQEDDASVNSRWVRGQRIYNYASLDGGQSFWRFKIEIPLGERAEEIFYSINGGPENSFFVPAADQNMRWVGYSCNGFSAGVDTAAFNGPDPLWRDVLRAHEKEPFHLLVGGGDQIYCDPLTREPEIAAWIELDKEADKIKHPLTPEMLSALDRFAFNHYTNWFRSGAFGQAIGKIPMLNMCDDHDIIDGFGSYPDNLNSSPVFSGIGSRGYFWYLLFQMFIVDDFDGTNLAPNTHTSKSIIIGGPGAWIPYPNHTFLSYLGPSVYILMLDCRAERKKDQVCTTFTYDRVFAALKALPAGVEHVVVQLGIPIIYPRMNAIETMLESKLNPLTILGKSGALGLSGFVNKFNKEAELLDDLNDHWCAAHHKKERNWLIETLQKVVLEGRFRVTFLSGDVHACAVGQVHSIKKIEPSKDPKFMLQVISSAIVNTPPPNAVLLMVSTFGKKRHKTLHFCDTDEEMLPLFKQDTDGSKLHIETIMGRRNYCIVDYLQDSGELRFDIRVETKQGAGTTKGYAVQAPPPRW